MKNRTFFPIFVLVLTISCAQTPKNKAVSAVETPFEPELYVASKGIIWGMGFLPDGDLLFTEKSGRLYRYSDGEKSEIGDLPQVYVRGQGGLLDIAVHPNYDENGHLYLTYASSEGEGDGGNTTLMRAKLRGNSLAEKKVLYKAGPNTKKGQHFGSRIVFDDEGYLYFSIGDRGNRDENPQDITRDGGKIYRLHADGRIPDTNPFVGVDGAKKAIFSYGHRNPQGMVRHPFTGEIWEHEHGPRGGDEINIIKAKDNYGWPVITYGINYSGTSITDITEKEGMQQPLHYWVPSIAPSGMAFVSSDAYPGYKGNLFVGSLAFQYLERLVMDGNKVVKREKLLEDLGRVRDVIEGPDGLLYVSVEGKGIYKLLPKS
ncbi:MAG: PQQ-dependent sugar dehydrogenase [Flavobacteriaceae bacterium]